MTEGGRAVLVLFVTAAAASDLRRGRIYNFLTLPTLAAGLLLLVMNTPEELLPVLGAMTAALLFLFPFWKTGGLGAGDIKLLAAVSGFLPSEEYLLCFAGAFAIGAAYGAARLLWTRGRVHTVHFAVPVAASVLMHLTGIF